MIQSRSVQIGSDRKRKIQIGRSGSDKCSSKGFIQGQATDMDWTLHTDL